MIVVSLILCGGFVCVSNFNCNYIEWYHTDITQVFVFFVLTVVAAESAIGLALLIVLYRNKKSIDVDDLSELKGWSY